MKSKQSKKFYSEVEFGEIRIIRIGKITMDIVDVEGSWSVFSISICTAEFQMGYSQTGGGMHCVSDVLQLEYLPKYTLLRNPYCWVNGFVR